MEMADRPHPEWCHACWRLIVGEATRPIRLGALGDEPVSIPMAGAVGTGLLLETRLRQHAIVRRIHVRSFAALFTPHLLPSIHVGVEGRTEPRQRQLSREGSRNGKAVLSKPVETGFSRNLQGQDHPYQRLANRMVTPNPLLSLDETASPPCPTAMARTIARPKPCPAVVRDASARAKR